METGDVRNLDSIYQNNTWVLKEATETMNVLGCRWVFTVKLNADGLVNKLKARLVAKGFNQEEGVNFMETYNAVVRISTIRIFFLCKNLKELEHHST